MLIFANPKATDTQKHYTQKLIKKYKSSLNRGIKACTKALTKNHGLLIIASDISPPDLVSHLPALAEEHGIPYFFVDSMEDLKESNDHNKETTCVFYKFEKGNEGKSVKKILETL